MSSANQVSENLEKIKQDIISGRYRLPDKYLSLVKKDPLIMSFVNGAGGYYYQFLALFVRYFKPKNILELGNALGVSTVMMYSELAPDASLTSVDIEKDQRYIPEAINKDSRMRMVIGDALDINIYGQKPPQQIDFLFTDTVHFYQQVKDEYDIYKNLLTDGAFILIDDIYVKDKGRLFNELPFEKWDLSDFCHHNGFGLLRFKKSDNTQQPLLRAASESARIGFRKFHAAKEELDGHFYKKFYNSMRQRAQTNQVLAKTIRTILKPIKKFYTPHDQEY